MTFLHPIWFLLALPLGASLWIWKPANWILGVFRALCLVLVVLALAGLSIKMPGQAGTVVVVADRSLSMPQGSQNNQKEAVELISRARASGDMVAVVAFGEKTLVEKQPQSEGFPGFVQDVGVNASNLADAIDTALTLVPEGAPGRILLLSDGRWTGIDPLLKSTQALARGIGIDYRAQERPQTNDLAVVSIESPPVVHYKESFLLSGVIQSPGAREAVITLYRDGKTVSQVKRLLRAGTNRVVFRDQANQTGNQAYTLGVEWVDPGTNPDPVPENNQARFLVGVNGPKPILHVSNQAGSGLARLLQGGGLDIRSIRPADASWTIETLSRFSSVIIENVPADQIGANGMEAIASWVRGSGAGLFMTGGRNSYGPGGYFKSPLDPILPVTMELRNEHRKLALAIVVALDRSGSMAMPVAGGRQKMDLANLGAAQVLDLLGPMDEFGCIAVDSAPHGVVDLGPVSDKAGARAKILGIQSMGGGIYVYQALLRSADMVSKAKAGTKHIILFADAMDAEEPGEYRQLLEKTDKAGITVSVIGLGTDRDKDAEFLKDVAKRGKGRVFFTDKPEELPRVFAQDTFVVARNTFLDEPVPVKSLPGLSLLSEQIPTTPDALKIGGYNLTYIRPQATLGTVTVDEYNAPVTASWRVGTGRIVCYTGEADGQFAGDIARWNRVGDYFTSLARWTAGSSNALSSNMLLTQEIRDGTAVVTLNLDPERTSDPFTGLPQATLLRSRPNEPIAEEKGILKWTGADTLEFQAPLDGSGTALVTVQVPGQNPATLPPVCLPYSPEFQPAASDRGVTTLEKLAQSTGGLERLELTSIWKDLPLAVRYAPMAPWLLLAAVVILLLEVVERRTSILFGLVDATARASAAYGKSSPREKSPAPKTGRALRPVAPTLAGNAPLGKIAPLSPGKQTPPTPDQTPSPSSPPPTSTVPSEEGILAALRKARERGQR